MIKKIWLLTNNIQKVLSESGGAYEDEVYSMPGRF